MLCVFTSCAEYAVMEAGQDWARSSRRRAVTTISSIAPSCLPSAAAALVRPPPVGGDPAPEIDALRT